MAYTPYLARVVRSAALHERSLPYISSLEVQGHSSTSICLKLADPDVATLPRAAQAALIRDLVARLENEGAAYDIGSYRDAPPGLRLWGGATVERADLASLLPWLDWAYREAKSAWARGRAPAQS